MMSEPCNSSCEIEAGGILATISGPQSTGWMAQPDDAEDILGLRTQQSGPCCSSSIKSQNDPNRCEDQKLSNCQSSSSVKPQLQMQVEGEANLPSQGRHGRRKSGNIQRRSSPKQNSTSLRFAADTSSGMVLKEEDNGRFMVTPVYESTSHESPSITRTHSAFFVPDLQEHLQDYAGIDYTKETKDLPENWLDLAIQQSSTSPVVGHHPGVTNSAIPGWLNSSPMTKRISLWSTFQDECNADTLDTAAGASKEICMNHLEAPRSIMACESQPISSPGPSGSRQRSHRRSCSDMDDPEGFISAWETEGNASTAMWKDKALGRDSRNPSFISSSDIGTFNRIQKLICTNVWDEQSAESSDSSTDLDAMHENETSRWTTLQIKLSPVDSMAHKSTCSLERTHIDSGTLPPHTNNAKTLTSDDIANEHGSERPLRHQRSRTTDLDLVGTAVPMQWHQISPDISPMASQELGWPPDRELSLKNSAGMFDIPRNRCGQWPGGDGNLQNGGELSVSGTCTAVLQDVPPHASSISALALSPRAEGGTAGTIQHHIQSGTNHNSGTDLVLSYQDGLRLNAMLAALATGGTRTDVLAAAEIPQDNVAPPPSPQPDSLMDRKPGAAVRAKAHLLLKVLRNNPAQSPEMLRRLIALAETPTGPEAIAKEGGLDTVVMVMSSEWANRIIATMCAELLRALLPGGIAMSRRKLLKRLPQLEAGALSSVGGKAVLQGDLDPAIEQGPPGADATCVTLTKKHVRKLRKRSNAISWACHALVRTMQRFQAEEAVQDKGSSALWGVLSPRNEPQSDMAHREIDSYIRRVAATEILEAGGVFVLINDLKLHAGHANVAYSAVGALLAIAQLGPQAREAIEKQQGRRAIRSAMTYHPAIGYGGRFASLAAWLGVPDDSSEGDAWSTAFKQPLNEPGDQNTAPSEQRSHDTKPPSSLKAFKAGLWRLGSSRRAPSVPLGASSLADPAAYTNIDSVKHIRMLEEDSVSPGFQESRGTEEKLWNRLMSSIAVGRRRD